MCPCRGVELCGSPQQWGQVAGLLGGSRQTTLQPAMAVERQGCPWLSRSCTPGVQAVQWWLLCPSSSVGVGGGAWDHLYPGGGQAKSAVSPSCMPNSLLSWKILVSLLNPSASARPSTNHPCLPQGDLHHRFQHHWWWSQSPSDQNQEPGQVSTDLGLVFMPCLSSAGSSPVQRLLSCL